MKKIFSFIVTVALSTVSFAQNCTPDLSINKTGVYPSATEGFATGYVNHIYEQVVQIKVIKDTVVDFQGSPTAATVLYATIDSVKGAPASLTYNCEPVDCEIPGGGIGCTKISGTPTLSEENQTYPLMIYTTLYGLPNDWLTLGIDPLPFPVEFPNYSITIEPEVNSVNEIEKNVYSNVYPNPTAGQFALELDAKNPVEVKSSVFNLLGNEIKTVTTQAGYGKNIVEFDNLNLQTGIYMVYVVEGANEVIHKLVVR